MGKSRATALLAGAIVVLSLIAATVQAEVSQKNGVRVAVDGSLAPSKLPRKGSAPVSVSVSGKIDSLNEASLPQLQKMTIAINSAGLLNLKGIPHCRIGHINPSNNQEALEACGSSLIGEGSFSADVKLPEQSPFPSEGKLLAFNGTIGGKPAIFGHIYGTKPLPPSFVLPFRIKQQKGTYGTVLEAAFPRATGEWGYVTGISLDLDKRFLSAGCPAPKGISRVPFPLMQTNFSFAGGLNLTNTLTRSCKAMG